MGMMGSTQPLVGQLRKDASGWDQDGVRGYEVKAGSKVTGISAGKKLMSRAIRTLCVAPAFCDFPLPDWVPRMVPLLAPGRGRISSEFILCRWEFELSILLTPLTFLPACQMISMSYAVSCSPTPLLTRAPLNVFNTVVGRGL